jgi:chitin disaccharide deacetylase
MRIILNADGFGHSDDTVRATIECFHSGALSSATIVPKMPASQLAIDFAQKHPEFSFGVHLVFTSDAAPASISDPKTIPALVNGDGSFLPPQRLRWLALRNKLPADQLEKEISAQIGVIRDHGISISHVASHADLHKFRPFVNALVNVLPRFGIKRVRSVQDTYIRKPFKSPTFWVGSFWRRRIMNRFITTDHLFLPGKLSDARAMHDWMPPVTDESIEVGAHPGYLEDWPNAERQSLQSFASRAVKAGHHLITWNQL